MFGAPKSIRYLGQVQLEIERTFGCGHHAEFLGCLDNILTLLTVAGQVRFDISRAVMITILLENAECMLFGLERIVRKYARAG